MDGDADAPGVEIERKFLVTRLPASAADAPSRALAQGYLAVDPDGAVVRVRRAGDDYTLTIKSGHGIERAEEELEIDQGRFDRLWTLTAGRRVEKVRYVLPADGGLTIELDVYGGQLEGLMTAEVEASSRGVVEAFHPPPWMRLDISDDRRYGNSALAAHGLPERAVSGEHGLLEGEPVAEGLVAVVLNELDVAREALAGGQEPAKAVHTARKTFKRVRAIIRVVRDGIGEEVAGRENAALRDAGRRLSGARDAKVVVDTFDRTLARAGDGLDGAALAPLRDLLVAEHVEAEAAAAGDAGAIDEVIESLTTVRADVEAWPVGPEVAAVLADGLGRLHRKGRKALRAAERSSGAARTEAMHDLRKRAKDLWHAAELLEVADPPRLASIAARAHRLADLIGDDHDLAVLTERARERSGRLPDALPLEELEATIERRRSKLQRKAIRVATDLYGEDLSSVRTAIGRLGDA